MNTLVARGQDWMSLTTNLLWIYQGKAFLHGNGSKLLFREYFAAYLILKGRVSVDNGGKIVRAKAGQWLVPWPGFRKQEFSENAEIISVRFQAHWPDGKPLFDHGLSKSFAASDYPALEKTARALLAIAREHIPREDPTQLAKAKFSLKSFYDMKAALLAFVSVFADTLATLGLRPTRIGTHDERILQALGYLDTMPLTQKIKERDLAANVGLGLSQFVRLFRTEMGVTPRHYLELRRLDSCRRLLVNSSLPLKQIACELGFSHHSDFSFWFKKHYNMSPKVYRDAPIYPLGI